MCELLPYANFRWVNDVHNFDFTTIALDSPIDYILPSSYIEVDLPARNARDICMTRTLTYHSDAREATRQARG